MTVEIRHLRYFVAVAEKLHFTQAAEELHLAQPALSHQIQRLESTLQIRLLHRNTRSVALTDAGVQFLVRAKAAVAAFDEALESASRLRLGEVGHVAFGINPRTQHHIPASVTRAMGERCPDVAVDVIAEATSMLVADVMGGHLDVALCLCPVEQAGLNIELVRRERLFVALPGGHPLSERTELSLTDLREESWLLPSDRKAIGCNTLLRQQCASLGIEIRAAGVHPDYDHAFSIVAGGLGIEIVPEDFVPEQEISGVHFVPLAEITMPLALVWRSDNVDPVLRQVFSAVHALCDEQGWDQAPVRRSAVSITLVA